MSSTLIVHIGRVFVFVLICCISGVLAMESLHKQVLPFLLRRLKDEVLNDLPPKIIQDYYCELSPLQVCSIRVFLYDICSFDGALAVCTFTYSAINIDFLID